MNLQTRLSLARNILLDIPRRSFLRKVKRHFNQGIIGAEIGVFQGHNAVDMLKCIPNIKRLYLVDPYTYSGPSEYEQEYLNAVKIIAYKNLEPYKDRIKWIHKPLNHKEIPEPLDFVYIDGDHSYEAVKHDIEQSQILVKPFGLIGGHDIKLSGVSKAVTEIYPTYKTRMSDWWIIHKKPKVAITHNIISPYRTPLFEELSKHLDLTVFFKQTIYNKRKWSTVKPQVKHKIGLKPLSLLFGGFETFIGADANLFTTWITFIFARLTRKKFILWTEERNYAPSPKYNFRYKTVKRIASQLTKNSDMIIALGNDAKKRLLKMGVPNQKIVIAPNSYPIKELREAYLKAPKAQSKKITFLSLSYIEERKGINHLIDAFSKLRRERNDIQLIIVGTGPNLNQLKKQAYGTPDITFTGYLPEKAKPEYYKKSDIFVLPSTREPWGLTINEAMICEKPIITTNNAGARELVRDNGYVVSPKDPFALYVSMKAILEKNLVEMGKKSWEYIQPYSIENTAKKFLQAI